MERYCLIANRTSGSGSAGAYIDRIKFLLTAEGADFEIRETQYPGHATELAEAAVKEGFDIIVAVGGDGTLRETAMRVVHTDRILGLLPCGTGNDYAASLTHSELLPQRAS